MFADLLATEGVEEIYLPGSPFGVMALHGGLEDGTDTIAHHVTELSAASLYAVIQPRGLWWHVPSIRYDPSDSAALASFLESVEVTFSLHGFGETGFEATALLGGTNRTLAFRLHEEFGERGVMSVVDLDAIPKRLHGTHPRNPVNRPPLGGVQVELAMELRSGHNRQLVVDALVACITKTDLEQLGAPEGG